MLVKSSDESSATCKWETSIWRMWVEGDYFETIVHWGHQQIQFPAEWGMPFDSPGSPTHIYMCKRCKRLSHVKELHQVVVTVSFRYRMLIRIDRSYLPIAIKCSIWGLDCTEVTPASKLTKWGSALSILLSTDLRLIKIGESNPQRASHAFSFKSSPPV